MLAVDDRLAERPARDAIGRGAQARQPSRERLRGERPGEQRDDERQRAADEEAPLDGGHLLLDVAQRRLHEHDPFHALVGDGERQDRGAPARQVLDALGVLMEVGGLGHLLDCASLQHTAARVRRGVQLEVADDEDGDAGDAERGGEALQLRGGQLLAERLQQLGGPDGLHARPQRGHARLLEIALERGQDEPREHDEDEQRRGRSNHRQPHAQAARALQHRADHAPKRYPTPRTVRISCGADGSRSSFSRRCRMCTSIVRCSR